MKRLTILIIGLLQSFLSISHAQVQPPQQQDSVVHVLVVRSPNAPTVDISGHLQFLADTWNNTVFNSPNPTSIAFVFGGNPVPLPANLSGTYATQMAAVKTFVNTRVGSLPTLREVQAADVVIAFTRSISSDGGVTICGAAPQDNWIKSPASPPGAPSFNPTNGLDLRGRDKFFVALVAVGPGCEGTRNQYNAAHEFGHLFGAGHYDPVGGTTPWLLSNSRAYGYTTIPRRKKFGWVTAVGETFPSVCNTTSTCNRLRRYK